MATKINTSKLNSANTSLIGKLIRTSSLAILASAVTNLGLYAAAGSLYPEVTSWSGAGPGQIIGANFVYLLMGTLVFYLIIRKSSNPARHYLIAASIGLLLSLALPISAGFGFGAPAGMPAGLATVITLCLMHIVSFAISVPMFIRLIKD
jgi:hypothetical protein